MKLLTEERSPVRGQASAGAAEGSGGVLALVMREERLRTVVEVSGYDSPSADAGGKAAARINDALLTGREALPADLDAVRYAIEQARVGRQRKR